MQTVLGSRKDQAIMRSMLNDGAHNVMSFCSMESSRLISLHVD